VSTSDTNSFDGSEQAPVLEGGVLAALPRTRPQRTSPRRAAARGKATSAKVRVSATSAKAKATSSHKATSSGKAAQPAAPKQGYEPEEEVELGNTVNPPSGVELVESVADIVGELANSGLAAGGRILKDAFSLLRRP
jgi:hypothetical protein